MARFALDLDAVGEGSIVVDDIDLTKHVHGVDLISQPGQPTTLLLRVIGAGTITADGVLREVPDEVDEAAVIKSWLEQLDPELLEQEVLNSHSWLEPPATPGAAWIQVLRRLAGP